LDSSVLQALYDCGAFIWDGEELTPNDPVYSIPGGFEELDALQAIFFVMKRAMFEFALSANSFAEVIASNSAGYLQWAFDVLDHWESCLADYSGSPFSGTGQTISKRLDGPKFGYLSNKDRVLIKDAVALECDAFLTRDLRLARNAVHINRELGLLVVNPGELWALLHPWAALFV
jgi:hypothetical protein